MKEDLMQLGLFGFTERRNGGVIQEVGLPSEAVYAKKKKTWSSCRAQASFTGWWYVWMLAET